MADYNQTNWLNIGRVAGYGTETWYHQFYWCGGGRIWNVYLIDKGNSYEFYAASEGHHRDAGVLTDKSIDEAKELAWQKTREMFGVTSDDRKVFDR